MPTTPRILEILGAAQWSCLAFAPIQRESAANLKTKDLPPRMVWVMGDVQTAGGPPRAAGPKQALATDRWPIEVHCWGKDLGGALRLRQAAISAVAAQMTGDHEVYRVTSTEIHGDEQHSVNGRCAVVSLEIETLLYEADLTKPGPEVEDAEYTRQAHAEKWTLRGGTPGDGRLHANPGDEQG